MIIARNTRLWFLCSLVLVLVVASTANARHNHSRSHRQDHERHIVSSSVRSNTVRSSAGIIDSAKMPWPSHEVRAMWVVRDSITTPQKIANVVSTARKYGFNTLFVQIRGRGDAFYNSKFEPRSEELADQPVTFDPLATIITEAHASGIQVHAWLNTYYVWSSNNLPASGDHVVNAHPDWLVRDVAGNVPMTASNASEGAFISPANQQARQFIHDVFLDVASRYDIDGIHFDYVRYPSEYYDYSPIALSEFAAYLPSQVPDCAVRIGNTTDPLAYVRAYPTYWAAWRRAQVTDLVRSISRDVKAIKPWVVVSAAVFANAEDAYDSRGQDWKEWLKEGIIDVVVPMAYNNSSQLVGSQLKDAETTAHQYGRFCYAGIGSWHISAESTNDKIKIARELGLQGIVLFSYGGLTNYGSSYEYLDKIESASFKRQAALPHLPWLSQRDENSNIGVVPTGG